MRQSACLVIIPNTVHKFVLLITRTSVDRASVSAIAPTKKVFGLKSMCRNLFVCNLVDSGSTHCICRIMVFASLWYFFVFYIFYRDESLTRMERQLI